ncbi:hypothetical protein BCON_0143g00160 [Botryotinia convoluta]|uniref:ABM domain-containing protein n=1 Tax=Botryotinia convoluta TaxID=54673 RepID=A0A4Z1HUB0_9HELO|nr:hypothetical protein BCON_0143g00160 [Botryotinia convoluta]
MARTQAPRLTAPTSWIVIQIPVDKTISDSKSEEGKKWLEIIKPLTKGFEHGVWSRLIERPEEVWLITGWETFEAIQKFEESDVYEGQLKAMRELSEGKEPVEFEEKQTRVMRYLHYWNSREGEEEFKAEAGLVTEGGESQNIFSEWVAGLKDEGMLGMEEVHCKFETIAWKFWDYTSEEEREMAEMDAEE